MKILLETGGALLLEDNGYLLGSYQAIPWAVYPCGEFGNDTVGRFIWEKTDIDKDLVMGDGLDTDTFPVLVVNEAHATAYYTFDGVDDYLSSWPEMPDEYTVIAALSDDYPGGKPYIQNCNDATIEALLTTPGAFDGNLHSMVVFDSVIDAENLAIIERKMLRRLWRDTVVDPFSARMIRDDDCALYLDFEVEADPFHDYSINETGSTDYSTVWDMGITFPVSGAAVVMDSDAALNLDELTIFIEAPNLDTEASAETILANGTNYVLGIALSAGICTVTLNGSAFSFTATGHRTLAVSVSNGEKPRFYLNGQYAGEGSTTATISTAGAGQLTIGNNAARNNPFASTLKKLSIYSRVLTPAEIRAAHIMARAERPFTT